MPTLSNSVLPIPKAWDEFEEITLDALKIKWDNPDLQKNGRSGQAQAGVDIFGKDYFFKEVGVQCKKYENTLTIKTIKQEITKAEKFIPSLDIFYVATTQPNDAKLQKEIRLVSKERVRNGKFPIGILFWNDSKIIRSTKEYLEYVIPYVTGKKTEKIYWKHATDIARRISKFVKLTDNTFQGKELIVFKLGEELAAWERFEVNLSGDDKSYPKEKIEQIEKIISNLYDKKTPDNITELLKGYSSANSWKQLDYAYQVYLAIRNSLLEAEMIH
jgi:hypothetical protein